MHKTILIAGGIGGMAVPVLRAGLKYTQQLQVSIDVTPAYVIGTILLAAIGAATVWFLNEKERKKAFIIGLSLPATISSLGGQVHDKAGTTALLNALTAPLALLVATAHAAEPPGEPAPSTPTPQSSFLRGRQFRVVGAQNKGVTVQFVDKDGHALDEYIPAGTKTRNLPDEATTAVVASPSGSSHKIDLSEQVGTVTVATVEVEKESKLGFWQALGLSSPVKETLKTKTDVHSVREVGQSLWIKRDDETPMKTMSLSGNTGVAKAYIFARKAPNAPYSDGMLLPGDKFTVLESNDTSGRWLNIRLIHLAPTPTPAPTSNP